jgi:hypothetical protein
MATLLHMVVADMLTLHDDTLRLNRDCCGSTDSLANIRATSGQRNMTLLQNDEQVDRGRAIADKLLGIIAAKQAAHLVAS